MTSPVDPMCASGRWLVTTASGVLHLIESTGVGGTVTATRVTAGPAGGDPRYPLGALRRDCQALTVTGVQHLTGTTMSHGIVVGEDMYLYLEPLDPTADLTLRRTTPVVSRRQAPMDNEGEVASPEPGDRKSVRERRAAARRRLLDFAPEPLQVGERQFRFVP